MVAELTSQSKLPKIVVSSFCLNYVPVAVLKTSDDMTERKYDCARLMEFQNVVRESLRIIGVNLLFRFFYVLYADRGLTVKGNSNTTLLKWIYVLFTSGKNLYFAPQNFWVTSWWLARWLVGLN